MSSGSAGLRVELLHQFGLLRDGLRIPLAPAAELVVAFLALADRPRARTAVAAALWPDRDDSAACLRRAVWIIDRGAPDLVDRTGHSIGLAAGVSIDVRDVAALAEQPHEQRRALDGDVHLLSGDLLPEWSFHWLDAPRESVRQTRLHTLEENARAALDSGRPATALKTALAAVGVDPLRESAQRIVIAAHLAEGNEAEALRQYTIFRTQLWEALRLRPSSVLEAMLPAPGPGARPERPPPRRRR